MKKKIVNLRLDEEIVKKLDNLSSRFLMSRSELIRQSVAIYLTLLENIGFYFKPSVVTNIDVYDERNAINVDLGNMTSLTVFVTSYSNIGELECDKLKVSLDKLAKFMARQIAIEATCRFTKPLAIMISTSNDLDYSLHFLKNLRKEIFKYYTKDTKIKVALTSYEPFFFQKNTSISCSTIGLRDLSIKNTPQRGDKIYLIGEPLNGLELLEKEKLAVSVDTVKKLAEMVKKGELNSIFPVKSGGIEEVANYIASIAGGRAKIYYTSNGCPATAVVVTSSNENLEFKEVGEIL